MTQVSTGEAEITPKKTETTEHEKTREKKERTRPPTKVVIRRLPPTLTKDAFINQISPLPDHDYLYFVRPDKSLGPFAFARAYINFIKQEDIFTFKEQFDNYTFMDKKGNEYPAIVEFAPFQRLPKKRLGRKKDPKMGTLEQDLAFINFMETRAKSAETGTAQHCPLEYFPPPEKKKITTTPLLDFLRQRKVERQRMRDERREERRRKDQERKRLKDAERDKHRLTGKLDPNSTRDTSSDSVLKSSASDDACGKEKTKFSLQLANGKHDHTNWKNKSEPENVIFHNKNFRCSQNQKGLPSFHKNDFLPTTEKLSRNQCLCLNKTKGAKSQFNWKDVKEDNYVNNLPEPFCANSSELRKNINSELINKASIYLRELTVTKPNKYSEINENFREIITNGNVKYEDAQPGVVKKINLHCDSARSKELRVNPQNSSVVFSKTHNSVKTFDECVSNNNNNNNRDDKYLRSNFRNDIHKKPATSSKKSCESSHIVRYWNQQFCNVTPLKSKKSNSSRRAITFKLIKSASWPGIGSYHYKKSLLELCQKKCSKFNLCSCNKFSVLNMNSSNKPLTEFGNITNYSVKPFQRFSNELKSWVSMKTLNTKHDTYACESEVIENVCHKCLPSAASSSHINLIDSFSQKPTPKKKTTLQKELDLGRFIYSDNHRLPAEKTRKFSSLRSSEYANKRIKGQVYTSVPFKNKLVQEIQKSRPLSNSHYPLPFIPHSSGSSFASKPICVISDSHSGGILPAFKSKPKQFSENLNSNK